MKKSFFTKLMGSYILFGILSILTFVLCLLLQVNMLTNGNVNAISPDRMIDENGVITELETVEKMDGWIEELDNRFQVCAVYGEKQTENQQYSQEELLNLISPNGEGEYIGFYTKREKIGKKFLIIYKREIMKVTTNLIVNNVSEETKIDVMWLFFPLLILEIFILSFYLRRKMNKPIQKITEGMKQLKAGNGETRIELSVEAEFKEIVDMFNSMAEDLQKEKAEKEELIRKKNQLLLELSHDIKTPIATIKSYANALGEGLVPEEKKRVTTIQLKERQTE